MLRCPCSLLSVTVVLFVIRDLRDRALRLQTEAIRIRAVAASLSFDEDRELFLQHAAALDTEAARLEVQARQTELREQACLEVSGSES
jgi:hypothetical protein